MKKKINTKLIVALVIVGVLAVTVVGLVAAQAVTLSPTQNGTAANRTPYSVFFGWMGRMMGFRGYYGTQATTGSQPLNVTVIDANTNTTTSYQVQSGFGMPYYQNQPQDITVTNLNTGTTSIYRGYYGYGGCGGMMSRFFP